MKPEGRRPRVLILTATVRPPEGAAMLGRRDVEARKGDYLQAMAFYAGLLGAGELDRIVFVDNSLEDLSFLSSTFGDPRIEYLSFDGLGYPPEYGRGYGEFLLLDWAVENAAAARDPGDRALWYKVTGRYALENMVSLMADFERRNRGGAAKGRKAAAFYANCRDLPRRWADMYFLGWERPFWMSRMKGLYRSLSASLSGRNPEEIFRDFLDGLKGEGVVRRFREAPRLRGVRGVDNSSYQDAKLKTLLRAAAYRFLPFLWI